MACQHHLPDLPPRFAPAVGLELARLKKTKKRGRPAEYNWPGVGEALLKGYKSKHGPMKTADELLQKCADFAGDLHPRGKTPNDKTIREAIVTHALHVAAGCVWGNSRSNFPALRIFPISVLCIHLAIAREGAGAVAGTIPAAASMAR